MIHMNTWIIIWYHKTNGDTFLFCSTILHEQSKLQYKYKVIWQSTIQ